jgi:hypothetical protein
MTIPKPTDLDAFASDRRPLPGAGPVAALICEDQVETRSSLEHLAALGFAEIVVFAARPLNFPAGIAARVVYCRTAEPGAATACLNALIARVPGRWVHYAWNAEYLFFPFSDARSVAEMTRFVEGERRESVAGVTVDLYAADLNAHPDGVDRASAHFDGHGYFASGRQGADGTALARQLEIFGGLRWRHEDDVPPALRRIDRPVLFRARPGLRMNRDFLLVDPELNARSSPWHRSLTACVASFRAAKALRALPGARDRIAGFMWHGSRPFAWRSQQLMEAGLMEPGQWF